MSASGRPPKLGASVEEGGTRFLLFTEARACSVRSFDADGRNTSEKALAPLGEGYFEARLDGVGHGDLYRFVLDGRELPDPYARFLPHGVHGPAMVVEPRYEWRFAAPGRRLHEHVIYELHVGTFTEAGTYEGARARLRELAELGVTALELMPLAAFAGERGWGYDGVAHYAPHAAYGTPDQLRAFVDEAHGLGLSVLLDVVYNHFGPSGNYLSAYSSEYFTRDLQNAWGDAPNFAHPAMRRYVLDNALYWLSEFLFDGLRLDATHALVDPSPKHLLQELAETVATLTPKRLLFAEDERNDPTLVTRAGIDALWADDFHHQLRVTLTGEKDGYYAAYRPGTQDIAKTIERGWLYEGQPYGEAAKPRGASADALSAERLVYCIQNHDQIGNRALGERLNHAVSLDAYAAVSLLFLLLPMTPLLFMGQEWAASSPFLYFTDHDEELGRLVSAGRRREFERFLAFSEPSATNVIPDPQAPETFLRSRLVWQEREHPAHARILELYRSALLLRRDDPVLNDPSRERLSVQALGAVLAVRRWHADDTRVIIVNFGPADVPAAELAALAKLADPVCLLSTSDARSSGGLPSESAVVLAGRSESMSSRDAHVKGEG